MVGGSYIVARIEIADRISILAQFSIPVDNLTKFGCFKESVQ